MGDKTRGEIMVKKIIQRCLPFLVAMLFVSCVSGGVRSSNASGRADPTIREEPTIAIQRGVIEEQQRTIAELGGAIGQVYSDIDSALEQLDRIIQGTNLIEAQWRAIDEFVLRIIEAKRRLIDVQHTDK